MDAMKVIKKHGAPGGLPVVTIYVDADAPGEDRTLYEHHISVTNYGEVLCLISDSSTPLDASTLNTILKDAGYASYSTALPITTSIRMLTNKIYHGVGIYGTTNTLYITTVTDTLSISEGSITSSSATSYSAVSSITDKVFKI